MVAAVQKSVAALGRRTEHANAERLREAAAQMAEAQGNAAFDAVAAQAEPPAVPRARRRARCCAAARFARC